MRCGRGAVAALVLVAACAGPRPAPRSPPPRAAAGVKIGQPYQVLGKWYYPSDDRSYDTTGIASWYGPGFHALPTANGERYDQDGLSAAHKTLPLPSYVEVTNLDNGRKLTVRINDRGPFVDGRIIDLSKRSAQLLGVDGPGTARVRVRRVFPDAPQVASLQPPPADIVPAPLPLPITAPAALPAAVTTVDVPGSTPSNPLPATVAAGTIFVQVAAVADQGRAEFLRGLLGAFGGVLTERSPAGLWRVRIGPYSSRTDATPILARVQAAGYTDARIVVAAPPGVSP